MYPCSCLTLDPISRCLVQDPGQARVEFALGVAARPSHHHRHSSQLALALLRLEVEDSSKDGGDVTSEASTPVSENGDTDDTDVEGPDLMPPSPRPLPAPVSAIAFLRVPHHLLPYCPSGNALSLVSRVISVKDVSQSIRTAPVRMSINQYVSRAFAPITAILITSHISWPHSEYSPAGSTL